LENRHGKIEPRMIVRGEEKIYSLCGLHRTRRNELTRMGLFPKPVKISDRATGYFLDEIVQWQAERAAERDRHPARKRIA